MAIRVSIVEDLDEVREGLRNFISLDPEIVVEGCFDNAEEACVQLPKIKPDIVIMDINFPGMNGITCMQKVGLLCPGTQFMMFTVYENDEKVFDALKAGASGYLLKKSGASQVAEAVKELFNGGAPMSAHIARKLVDSFHQNQDKKADEELGLTPRENEIILLLSRGLLYKEIADKLGISVNTVRQHIHHIYEKLHVQNKTEAINRLLHRD